MTVWFTLIFLLTVLHKPIVLYYSIAVVCKLELIKILYPSMYIAGFRIHLIKLEFTFSEPFGVSTYGSEKVNSALQNMIDYVRKKAITTV